MTVAVVLAVAPLPVRCQEVEGGYLLGRCPPASGRDPRNAPALVLGGTGLDPRIDAGTALAVTGRGLLTATDHVDSVRVPLLAEELAATQSLVCSNGVDYLPPLIVRNQGRKDGVPDESSRRVWRR